MTYEVSGTAADHFRQGDVLNIDIDGLGKEVGLTTGLAEVAILSQTCDVVQDSKPFILVAPALYVSESSYREADKGRKPLLIPLFDGWVADAGRAFSVSKERLQGKVLIRHSASSDQGKEAIQIRASVARAFGRFPFPDDIPPVFNKIISYLQHVTGREGNFSKIIDSIHPIRVKADDWNGRSIHITVYIIIPTKEFIPREEVDTTWRWERLQNMHGSKIVSSELSLDDVSFMINEIHKLDSSLWDMTSLWNLWTKVGILLSTKIKPDLCLRVKDIDVQVISDQEFTFRDYLRSEALDIEALSKSDLDPR